MFRAQRSLNRPENSSLFRYLLQGPDPGRDMASVPVLREATAATGTTRSQRIQIREVHSLNLTSNTARGVKNWVRGDFWRSTGSHSINVIKQRQLQKPKISTRGALMFPPVFDLWRMCAFLCSLASLFFLCQLNSSSCLSSSRCLRRPPHTHPAHEL